MKFLFGLLGLLALFALYVRLAPSDPARWHRGIQNISPPPERSFSTSLQNVDFAQLNALILQTARTKLSAGSVEAQHITYVTRSALWGFPDYTTVERTGSETTIIGRSRFGKKDLGVNKARILGWAMALQKAGG